MILENKYKALNIGKKMFKIGERKNVLKQNRMF